MQRADARKVGRMRVFVSVFLVLFFVSCAGFKGNRLEDLRTSTVKICAVNPLTNKVMSCGRGFVSADSKDIITAGHVVSPMMRTVLVGGEDDIRVLERPFVMATTDVDMALLHESLPEGAVLPLCDPLFGEFESVVVWAQNGPIKGRATGLTRSSLWMFPPIKGGDSGSPIVSIERKCIIGLVSQVMYYIKKDGSHEDHHTIGVSSSAIKWLIGAADRIYNTPEGDNAGQDTDSEEVEK